MAGCNNYWAWVIGIVLLIFVFGGFGIGGFGMLGMGLLFPAMATGMILFWVGVLWLIVQLVKHFFFDHDEISDPLTTLKIRYVKGEISKKQYNAMKKELK